MKILIATGGSGGHIFPALVTARVLKDRGHDIVFAGSFAKSAAKVTAEGYLAFEMSSRGFSSRSLGSMVEFVELMLKACGESWRVISEQKPQVVVGFGGYGAFPVVFVAALRGIPTMIHEQNVVPGKANRVLTQVVRRIAVSFSQALKNFPKEKCVFTGCPTRPLLSSFTREAALKLFGLESDRLTILVLGGSQGSRRINAEFMKVLPELIKSHRIQVIHLSGDSDFPALKGQYEKMGIPFSLFAFSDQIDQAYGLADLVLSRAGAMTVTELAAYGLPAILIPYPYAGGHQRDNALVLSSTQASRLLEERDLTADSLKKNFLEMMGSQKTKNDILKCYAGIYRPDAASRLADEIERLK